MLTCNALFILPNCSNLHLICFIINIINIKFCHIYTSIISRNVKFFSTYIQADLTCDDPFSDDGAGLALEAAAVAALHDRHRAVGGAGRRRQLRLAAAARGL